MNCYLKYDTLDIFFWYAKFNLINKVFIIRRKVLGLMVSPAKLLVLVIVFLNSDNEL